jgi:hypothetical protein
VLEILKQSEHSAHLLKILNRFLTLTENSEHILNILNIDCTESEHYVQNVQTVSEFLAQKLVYSEFQEFRVGEETRTIFIPFDFTRKRLEPTFRQCSECSDSVQTFQTMFRICSNFSDNVIDQFLC